MEGRSTPQSIPSSGGVRAGDHRSTTHPTASWTGAVAPIAEAAIARDLELGEEDVGADANGDGAANDDDEASNDLPPLEPILSHAHSMVGSYRRQNFAATGARSTVLSGALYGEAGQRTEADRQAAVAEERSLLRDNEIIPPKHPRKSSDASGVVGALSRRLSIQALKRSRSTARDEENAVVDEGAPTETSPLLGAPDLPYGGLGDEANVDAKWDEAVAEGKIKTSWRREVKVMARYSGPLMVTFLLQYSLTVASIFTVGHLGPTELGAVSLASMTANITGYAIYYGLTTALDTLCGQAFGSGYKTLVGLQTQRMVLFLWSITIPIALIWGSGSQILQAIVPEKETARLAGLYLKVLIPGAPFYSLFLAGSRFVQAQGLFQAQLYVLLFCAPLNAFLNWFFVWQLKMGFIGAPIAVVITQILMPFCLWLYIYFVAGRECWGGFDKRALHNWGPMVKLAIPGLVMLLAEWLAFEMLTMSSSWISGEHLAAQACLGTITGITFQVPFALSIAASTRVANFIGATLVDAAKYAAWISFFFAAAIGIANMVLLAGLRQWIPQLFTDDPAVKDIVASMLPLCAAFQLFDSLSAFCNGILRGLGRQEIGGYVNLFAYYVIALPISFSTGFGLGWGLYGLWAGPALGLGIVAAIEGVFLYRTDWNQAVEAARKRNEAA